MRNVIYSSSEELKKNSLFVSVVTFSLWKPLRAVSCRGLIFFILLICLLCPGLHLAVIFTVKSICSRQKQHLILLWVASVEFCPPKTSHALVLEALKAESLPPCHLVYIFSYLSSWPLWVFPSKFCTKINNTSNARPPPRPEKLAMKQRSKFMVISTTEILAQTHAHAQAGIVRCTQLPLVCFTVNNAYAWSEGDHKRLTFISHSKKLELSS